MMWLDKLKSFVSGESLLRKTLAYFDVFVMFYVAIHLAIRVNASVRLKETVVLGFLIVLLFSINVLRLRFSSIENSRKRTRVSSYILGLVLLIALIKIILATQSQSSILYAIKPVFETGIFVYFLFRLLSFVRFIYGIYFNPAIVFIGSFIGIIFIGTFLLLMPGATTQEGSLTLIDALFTSTSAVCVTGLIVVDTASDFTVLGQSIILVLIQTGGLGILTFTSFFAFFFRGSTSFKEGLNIKDFMAQESMGDVFKVAVHVVVLTLVSEGIGFLFIYSNVSTTEEIQNPFFFSLFHAISAFCNAGFSTMTNGLNEPFLKFNYGLQWVLMCLIILGGIGHGVILNFLQFFKSRLKFNYTGRFKLPDIRVITFNSKIVLATTLFLLVIGFALVAILENNNTLLEHDSIFGKITASAFHSVTPRTAGFNAVDYTNFSIPAIMVIIFLMWIGGSPASTAGGIKTSTFALATLNIWAVVRGKSRIEIFKRRVSAESVSRAFAILSLSLITIGVAALGLFITEPAGTSPVKIIFECFSAYSTVGLSLNFTGTLSTSGKFIIIITMFVGRIGMLNLLYGLLRELSHQFYEYPKDTVLIS